MNSFSKHYSINYDNYDHVNIVNKNNNNNNINLNNTNRIVHICTFVTIYDKPSNKKRYI